MAFPVVILYIVQSLLSPDVLPEEIRALHVNIILGILAILACLPVIIASRIGKVPDIYFLLTMVFASAIAMVLTGWVGGVLSNLSNLLPVVLTFPFLVISCNSLKRLRIFVGFLALAALFILFQDLLALSTLDSASRYVFVQNVDGNADSVRLLRARGLGVLADPNDLAQFFITVLPLLWLRWKKGSPIANFLFILLPASGLLYGIYITHSRGAIVGIVILLWFTFREKLGITASSIITVLLIFGMIALNVSGGRAINDDDGGRVAAWGTGLEVFRAHPLFGIGMGNFGEYNDTGMTAHNSYVLCIAELGIVGYFSWMGMIVCGWTGMTRLRKLVPPPARVSKEDKLRQEYLRETNPAPTANLPDHTPAFASMVFANPFDPNPALASASGAAALPAMGAPSLNASATPIHLQATADESIRPSDAEIAYAARIIQIAMVGLLATCFFISRTYSMTLYVTLGMAAALRIIEGRATGDFGISTRAIFKRVAQVVVTSIVLLYLFVRFNGHR